MKKIFENILICMFIRCPELPFDVLKAKQVGRVKVAVPRDVLLFFMNQTHLGP